MLYFVPLAAGTWGGMEVSRAEAEQGRGLVGQLLAQPSGAVLAFNLQSEHVHVCMCSCNGQARQMVCRQGAARVAYWPTVKFSTHLSARLAPAPSAGVLRLLSSVGVALPPPHLLQGVLDPRLLAWLLEPQLLYVGASYRVLGWAEAEGSRWAIGLPQRWSMLLQRLDE